MIIVDALTQTKFLSQLQFKCKKIQEYDVKMKIGRPLPLQIILCTTTVFITGAQAMEDDMVRHRTQIGGRIIHHTATPGRETLVEGVVFYDPRLPKNRRLNFWPRIEIVSYTCPAVADVRGLEKPRSMGRCPEYKKQPSVPMGATATEIEVIKSSSRDGSLTGTDFYSPTGTLTLSSRTDKNQRVDTKRLTCRLGQKDPLIIDFEYKEFLYHIPRSFAFSKGYLTRENPKTPTIPSTSPCFTFSCWVLPGRQQQEIFSWSYLAPELELKGQKKRMALGIDPVSNKTSHRAFLKAPIVETSAAIPALTKGSPPLKIVTKQKKSLKDELKLSSEFATSATNWVHLLFFVNAVNKSVKVHVNGKETLTTSNPNIISLNEPCSLQIGDSRYANQGLIADTNLANGQNLPPSTFYNVTSEDTLTPKNFTGPFGKNGFQLRGVTKEQLETQRKAEELKKKSQPITPTQVVVKTTVTPTPVTINKPTIQPVVQKPVTNTQTKPVVQKASTTPIQSPVQKPVPNTQTKPVIQKASTTPIQSPVQKPVPNTQIKPVVPKTGTAVPQQGVKQLEAQRKAQTLKQQQAETLQKQQQLAAQRKALEMRRPLDTSGNNTQWKLNGSVSFPLKSPTTL